MKKVMFLMAIAGMFAFAACGDKNTVESTLDELRATEHTTTTTVHDTIPIHDTTVVVRDTIVHDTTTVYREVEIPVHDTVEIPGESHEYVLRLRQWHNRWLGVSGGYLIGEDSVVLSKYEGATLLNTWRGTARHRGTISLNVGNTAYPVSVIGDSCWLAAMGGGVYGGSISGHNVVMTLGPQAIQGPVVLNGFDWAPYLTAHEAMGQRVRFDADHQARGYVIDADGRTAGVITAPYTTTTPSDTTTRRETGRDTSWNGCGHLVSSSLTSVLIQHTLARTGVVTVNYNIAPLTETFTVSETTIYYTQYMVSGLANQAAIGTTANFTGNSVTIGGVTLTLTPGAQTWCNLTYTTATLTSNGLVVSFTYNGGTGTVTIQVPWQTPTEEWENLVYLVVTDGYEYQIFSATSQRHQFMVAIVHNASGYKMFWKDVTDAPMTMPSRSSCDSASITATMYNFYINAASNGGYATKIIPHNSSTTLHDGVVYSEELSNWWQLTYRLAPSNTQAYVMGGSSWTMAGDSGRNALRGQADLANNTITVDYGTTTRTWYF